MVEPLVVQEVLVWLGLSELQAKVYLVLLEVGKADAETISKLLSISRSDAECALCGLEALGLVKGMRSSVFSAHAEE
jgi:predicted transcriptional regulator